MASPSHDQAMLQHHHQQHSQGRRSQTGDVEWQRIFEELEASQGGLTQDFDMFGSSTSASMQYPPLQSIETASAPDLEPQMSAMSNGSLSYSGLQYDHNFRPLWPTISAPASAYSLSIPEHEQWNPPMEQLYGQPPLMHTSYPALGHNVEDSVCHPQPAHHLLAGPSPFLSEGSPMHPGFMEEGWDRPEMQQLCSNRNGNENDDVVDADAADPCYAQLLYHCLKESPEHILSLRELYDWVRDHSQKAKDPKNRGWQNSVRHNLSMNAVCTFTCLPRYTY